MPNFYEQLIIFLVLLLFARDLVVAYARKKGWINGDPTKKVDELQGYINKEVKTDINQLYKHADIANREMGEIKSEMSGLNQRLGGIEGKVDILIKRR